MSRIISASLSPNTEGNDVWLALRVLFTPWKWQRGMGIGKVEAWFRKYSGFSCAVSFNSGRSALLAILKAFDIGKGDEVIVQAFTCVAVPNSVRWAGATPIFTDIEGSYNLDPTDIKKKLSKKTKAIIVQHTFGKSAKTEEIIAIAKQNDIRVIEDFAHTMSLPMKGDAAFFSFGRDKVISSVFGGLAIIQDHYPVQIEKIKSYHKKLNTSSIFWIFQQLCHPIAFSIILPLYQSGIGKLLLVALQKMTVVSFPVYPEEKLGHQPKDFPGKYPNALAILLLNQLKKLERYTAQRKDISKIYGNENAYLRFPKRVENPDIVMAKAKKYGILLGNWYHHVVDPTTVGYTTGSCPKAEEAAKHIINLPTRIAHDDAGRVLAVL